jgi:anaerobic magnesium-protoporphyrin IX monomethyl ester cyclase
MHGRPIANVHTSRGCPFKCSFCSSSWFDGVKWRARSAVNIVDEIELLQRRWGYGAVAFMDDLFTMDARRVIAICEELLRRRLDVWWWCFTRADTLVRNPEMTRLMARAGCKQVFIGVESATEAVLRDYNKKLQVDMPARAVALARACGIEVLASYILGDIRERRRDVLRTIRYAKALDSDTAQFSILTPFPGTELWTRVQDRIVDRDWAHYTGQRAVMDLPHLGPRELQWLLVRAYVEFYFRSRKSVYGFYRFLRNRRFGLDALVELFRSRYCA